MVPSLLPEKKLTPFHMQRNCNAHAIAALATARPSTEIEAAKETLENRKR
jgi:hypothetical protein